MPDGAQERTITNKKGEEISERNVARGKGSNPTQNVRCV